MFYTASSIISPTMVLVPVFLILFLHTFSKGAAQSYTAAVVEYATPYTPVLSADEVMIRNTANYIDYMKNASLKQVDIIVFPEDGLFHNNARRAVKVPSPTDGLSPCDENTTFHQALVALSCASRAYGLYTVVNLREVYHNTSSNETSWYNTNVAFDRNGTVVGRYRKFNPYGESVNKTSTPEYSVFKTDFGIQFGMFTCFDIEFKEPALVLAEDLGIRHFVFPNCWSSELPFLSAIQMQWGWSLGLKVTLLAAGCNDPLAGGSGSGIYVGKQGTQIYMQTNSHTSKMLIATIQPNFNSTGNNTEPMSNKIKTTPTNMTPAKGEPYFETLLTKEYSDPYNNTNSSLVMLRDYLEVYETKLLIDSDEIAGLNVSFTNNSKVNLSLTTEVTLCQNYFCCFFKVEVIDSFSTTPPAQFIRGDDFSHLTYRLAVFDGVRSYGGGVATGGVQVCGIISCLNDSISSCGLRADSTDSTPTPFVGNLYKVGTTFKRIKISSEFLYNDTFIFPSVMVTGEEDEFGQLLDQDDVQFEKYEPFNHSSLCSLRIDKTISNLISASLYGRQFNRDGEPRTELSYANSLVASYTMLLLLCFSVKLNIY